MWRSAWLACALALSCGDDPAANGATAETPAPPGPDLDGKIEPAPRSEVAYARAVIDSLRTRDWEGYTNLLACRADMVGIFAETDRYSDRNRRRRRRMVWRRVNQLRDGEARSGWRSARRSPQERELDWTTLELRDVWRVAVEDERLPPGTTYARIVVELAAAGEVRWLDLGVCVEAKRGWVTLHPMSWSASPPPPESSESLLGLERGPT